MRQEFAQHYPRPGWVEHDAEDIWRDTVDTLRKAAAADGGKVAAVGITNQRETVVVWDRKTGDPVHNAIVWQDRRTAGLCAQLKADGNERLVRERGELAFGTIGSFLLWRLTGGKVHATDASNASRTLLFDIHKGAWDADMLRMLDIPEALLPEVKDNSTIFGETTSDLLGEAIPIGGMAGDQQAAAIG